VPGSPSPFRRHAAQQAIFCDGLGAPFTALLCRLLGARIDAGSPLGRRLDTWPGTPEADALVLRLTGGLHAAVLTGAAPALAALYPPAPMPDPDRLWAAMAPVLAADSFQACLDSAPQTNEVMRSAPLAAGLLVVAAETGQPLRLLELGASAGLNLLPDRYRLELGSTVAGDPASPLRLASEWGGGDPPAMPLVVAERAGVDLNPLAPADPADRLRLLSYIWPDQPARLDRMRTALAIAAANPPALSRGDAADFVEAQVAPAAGAATVVMHSIAYQYFPHATQARIAAHMAGMGAAATAAAPIAWLRYEMPDPSAPALPELRLTLWPGGADRLLAVGHAHGASVAWRA
jgi:hypothetical protein